MPYDTVIRCMKLQIKLVLVNKNENRDDFDFDIVNFPFLDGYVPLRASFHNLSGLLESAIMLRTLMREINV